MRKSLILASILFFSSSLYSACLPKVYHGESNSWTALW
jgi:hypothetical protein